MELKNKDIENFVDDMVKPFTLTMYSKRRSGKTFLTKNLIYYLAKKQMFNCIFCLSNTAHLTDDYNYLQKSHIKTFSEEFINDLIKGQQKTQKKLRPHILLIIDDCVGNASNKNASSTNSSLINEIYMTGRHYNISCIFINQSVTNSTTTQVRNNSDYSMLSKLNHNQLENIYEALAVVDKKNFFEMIFKNTNDFNFVVFDSVKSSNDIHDYLFKLKANKLNYFIKQ